MLNCSTHWFTFLEWTNISQLYFYETNNSSIKSYMKRFSLSNTFSLNSLNPYTDNDIEVTKTSDTERYLISLFFFANSLPGTILLPVFRFF